MTPSDRTYFASIRDTVRSLRSVRARWISASVLTGPSGVGSRCEDAAADPAVARIVSEAAHAQCKPLENVPYEAAYRREMIRVYTRRGVQALAAGAPAAGGVQAPAAGVGAPAAGG